MTHPDRIVIVGAGLAGARAADALRAEGFVGPLTMVGDEPHLPYERPPLSKSYLAGTSSRDAVFVHAAAWYAEHDVELRLGTAVTGIARADKRVEFADGSDLGYGRLLLATGASPRRLSIPGADAECVHYLRTLDDSDAIGRTIARVRRLVVIGAGWVGLEVTAAARAAGVAVTVVESLELPLLRVLGPEVATVFADLHREQGVELRFGAALTEIVVDGSHAVGVRLRDGTVLPADAVLVAVGAVPNTGLAEACGLAVDNGVVVDDSLRSSDADVFAVGDVASAFHPLLDRHVRVEHWANALKQPAVAAAAMLGRTVSYRDLPYFYTDQYDLGMEYTGYAAPGDYDKVVVRGDLTKREFIAFWLAGGRVLAGMNVNVWDVTDPITALIGSRRSVDPQRLADDSVPLGEV